MYSKKSFMFWQRFILIVEFVVVSNGGDETTTCHVYIPSTAPNWAAPSAKRGFLRLCLPLLEKTRMFMYVCIQFTGIPIPTINNRISGSWNSENMTQILDVWKLRPKLAVLEYSFVYMKMVVTVHEMWPKNLSYLWKPRLQRGVYKIEALVCLSVCLWIHSSETRTLIPMRFLFVRIMVSARRFLDIYGGN